MELEIIEEEMGLEKRVFKKNNLIRPANRKTRMLFCQEKRNWTKEDWKKLFSADETMVVIKNACKVQIWGKSDKKHVPHLICCEDKKASRSHALGMRFIAGLRGFNSSIRHHRQCQIYRYIFKLSHTIPNMVFWEPYRNFSAR